MVSFSNEIEIEKAHFIIVHSIDKWYEYALRRIDFCF